MKRVVVADDDPSIQDVIKLILTRAGYETVIYSNADAILNNDFLEPDLFILDRQLQNVDGLDVCRYLKKRPNFSTPIIIFSASGYVSEMAKDAGADDFLEKPFKINTLLEMIESLMVKVELE